MSEARTAERSPVLETARRPMSRANGQLHRLATSYGIGTCYPHETPRGPTDSFPSQLWLPHGRHVVRLCARLGMRIIETTATLVPSEIRQRGTAGYMRITMRALESAPGVGVFDPPKASWHEGDGRRTSRDSGRRTDLSRRIVTVGRYEPTDSPPILIAEKPDAKLLLPDMSASPWRHRAFAQSVSVVRMAAAKVQAVRRPTMTTAIGLTATSCMFFFPLGARARRFTQGLLYVR